MARAAQPVALGRHIACVVQGLCLGGCAAGCAPHGPTRRCTCPTSVDGDDVHACEAQQARTRRLDRGSALGMRVVHGSTAGRKGRLRVGGG